MTAVARITGLLEALGVHGVLELIAVAGGLGLVVLLALMLLQVARRGRRLKGLVAHTPRPLCTIDPGALGVGSSKLALELAKNAHDGVAPYIERDNDATLRSLLRNDEHRFVLLVGTAGSGKTRTAYEMTCAEHGELQVLIPKKPWPEGGSTGPEAFAEILKLKLPLRARRECVLWLDDLAAYLDQSAVDADDLRTWLAAGQKRRIVATLRPGDQERLLSKDAPAGKRASRIMELAAEHEVLQEWSRAEQDRALGEYHPHPDMKEFSRTLASVPRLQQRLRNALADKNGRAAVILAAVGCHRAGITGPIPEELLRKLFPHYLRTGASHSLEELFAKSLAWVADPGDAPMPLLEQATDASPHYRIHSVALEKIKPEDAPVAATWSLLLDELTNPAQLAALSNAAFLAGERDIGLKALMRVMDNPANSAVQAAAQRIWSDHVAGTSQGSNAVRTAEAERQVTAAIGQPSHTTAPRKPVRRLASINQNILLRALIRVVSLLIIDVLALWLALIVAYALRDVLAGNALGDVLAGARLDVYRHEVDKRIAFVALLVILLFVQSGLYGTQTRRADYARLLAALTVATLGFLIVAAIAKGNIVPTAVIPLALIFALFFVVLGRVVHTRVTQWLQHLALGGTPRRALIGTHARIKRVHDTMGHPDARHEVIGWIGIDGGADDDPVLPYLGSINELAAVIASQQLDDLVICQTFDETPVIEIVRTAQEAGAHVRALARGRSFLINTSRYVAGERLPLEHLRLPGFDAGQWSIKRTFDIAASGLLLLLSWWLFVVIPIIVRLSSKGPTFVSISSIGRNEKPFSLRKFRTTHVPAKGVQQPPMTRVGKCLDRLALDELPQLINVFRGQMSLVGPWPISVSDLPKLEAWQRDRFGVVPGITGLWQISGRRDRDYADMVRLDLSYMQRWSLFLDLEILIKTIPAVLTGRRARFVGSESSPT